MTVRLPFRRSSRAAFFMSDIRIITTLRHINKHEVGENYE